MYTVYILKSIEMQWPSQTAIVSTRFAMSWVTHGYQVSRITNLHRAQAPIGYLIVDLHTCLGG